MNAKARQVHEPEAELANAKEALDDAARLLRVIGTLPTVPIRVPLWALLEAIDALEPPDLQQIVRRVNERLASFGRP